MPDQGGRYCSDSCRKQPQLNWKLANVEELMEEHDGLVRAANVQTSNIVTSRPIIKLYSLKISSSQEMIPCQEEIEENSAASPAVATPEERTRREAARRALKQMSE